MKKVLVISYYFPPSNFVGGKRISTWYRNFHKHDLYPIVVTRQWDEQQKDIINTKSIPQLDKEVDDFGTIYRMPTKVSLRDWCSKYSLLKPIQKTLSLGELIAGNVFFKALHFGNFLKQCQKLVKEDPEIEYVIVSGGPFESFYIGHYLKNKYAHLKWIPDYRDEWTTHTGYSKKGLINLVLHKFQLRNEKMWTSNCDFFLGTSDQGISNISKLISKPGHRILNGFDIDRLSERKIDIDSSEILITYAGTLYDNQAIGKIVDLVIKCVTDLKINVRLQLIGIETVPGQRAKVVKLMKGHENTITLVNKVSNIELTKYLQNSDFLLLTSYENIKDWYPVKLFDYFCAQRPILLYPSDEGAMEEFINNTNCGFVGDDEKSTLIFLKKVALGKDQGVVPAYDPLIEKASYYTNSHQIGMLCEHLKRSNEN